MAGLILKEEYFHSDSRSIFSPDAHRLLAENLRADPDPTVAAGLSAGVGIASVQACSSVSGVMPNASR